MKKKIFLGIFLVLLIIVGMQFFSFESDREKLHEYLGDQKISGISDPIDCELIEGSGPLKKTAVVLIHGHGESYDDMVNLGLKISSTGRTAFICKNFGFVKEELKEQGIQDWKWLTYQLLWQRSSYQGLMTIAYRGVIDDLKSKGYDEIILVGFSMGSHIAMYTGALSDDVDYTIGIAGLAPYKSFFDDAPTTMVPEIYHDFTMGDVSCMNKKITWLHGKNDKVIYYQDARSVQLPCDHAEWKSFELLDDTDGAHEIPTNLVIDLLDNYEESKN